MQQVWADGHSGGDRSPPRAAAVAVLLLSLVALGIVAVLESRLYLNHDVAWYIQAARQIGF